MIDNWYILNYDHLSLAPFGFTAFLRTSIPFFLTIFMVKVAWLIKNLSLIESRHFSIVFKPSYSVMSFVWRVSITLEVKYSAYPWAALLVSITDPR